VGEGGLVDAMVVGEDPSTTSEYGLRSGLASLGPRPDSVRVAAMVGVGVWAGEVCGVREDSPPQATANRRKKSQRGFFTRI